MTLLEFYESEWFKARPEPIKDLFYKFPVNREWFLQTQGEDIYYGIRILGWDEVIDGEPTARIYVGSPAFPRNVFGIAQSDLLSEDFVKDKVIKYHSDKVLDID